MSQSSAQYHVFIKEILEYQKVWTIKDDQGFPSSPNSDGETAIPFWSLETRVEKILENVPRYRNFRVNEITLDDFINKWLTGLEADGLYVGVNWSGKSATGYDIKPKDVRKRIKFEGKID